MKAEGGRYLTILGGGYSGYSGPLHNLSGVTGPTGPIATLGCQRSPLRACPTIRRDAPRPV
jgi:hypothetical protein